MFAHQSPNCSFTVWWCHLVLEECILEDMKNSTWAMGSGNLRKPFSIWATPRKVYCSQAVTAAGEGRVLQSKHFDRLKSSSAFETLIECPLPDWFLHTKQTTCWRSVLKIKPRASHNLDKSLPELFLQPLFVLGVPKIRHAPIFESHCFKA